MTVTKAQKKVKNNSSSGAAPGEVRGRGMSQRKRSPTYRGIKDSRTKYRSHKKSDADVRKLKQEGLGGYKKQEPLFQKGNSVKRRGKDEKQH